jgi:hypothetical protein
MSSRRILMMDSHTRSWSGIMIGLTDPRATRQMYLCCKTGHLPAPAARRQRSVESTRSTITPDCPR